MPSIFERIRNYFRRPAPETIQQQLEAKQAAIAQKQEQVKVPTPQSEYTDAEIEVIIHKDKRINIEELRQMVQAAYAGANVKITPKYRQQQEPEPPAQIAVGDFVNNLEMSDLKSDYQGLGARMARKVSVEALNNPRKFEQEVSRKFFGVDNPKELSRKQRDLVNLIYDRGSEPYVRTK